MISQREIRAFADRRFHILPPPFFVILFTSLPAIKDANAAMAAIIRQTKMLIKIVKKLVPEENGRS